MLHIVCLILKIIGILLAVVLGLVLLAALLVLAVPVRIGAEGSFYGKPEGKVRITWLFGLLSVLAEYRNGLFLRVRLFGIRLVDDTGEVKPESEPRAEADPGFDTGPEPILSAQEWKEEPGEDLNADPGEEAGEKPKGEPGEPGSVSGRPGARPKRMAKKKSPFSGLVRRIRGILCNMGKAVSGAFLRLWRGVKKAEGMYQGAVEFWEKEENRKSIRLIQRQLSRLFRHIRPKKMRGEVTFGMEDPYRMGQILRAAAFLYPVYGGQITVTPVFDKTMLEGEMAFQMRLRLGTLLALAGRLMLDRTIRGWCKKMINRGGI